MDFATAELALMPAVMQWHFARKRWWHPVRYWTAARHLSRVCAGLLEVDD